MKRRKFLTTTAVNGTAFTAVCSLPRPTVAKEIRELRMVTAWPKNFPGLGTSAESLARRITTMSRGELVVRVSAAGELVPAFQALDAVSSGSAHMSHSASYYWQGKSPAFSFFTTVPFGLTSVEQSAWIHHGGGQELWDQVAAPFGVKPFPALSSGVQMGGWFRKEINKLEDLRGLKFRIPGLGGEVFRRLGVTVVNIPASEIFQSLQMGTVDGTEMIGPWHDLAAGFYKVAKYYYWPGIHEPGGTAEVLVNLNVWKSLSDEHKEIVKSAIEAEAWRGTTEVQAHSADALKQLVEEHGVELRRFSDEMLTEMGQVAGEVVKEIGRSDPMSQRVYESYLAFRTKAVAWSRISEQAYLDARSLPFDDG